MSDDAKISRRYRELAREEPPRHLDEAILAAGRRAVAPSRSRRWYVPLAAAAIIVLAVAVTLHVERERPGDAESLVAMKAEPIVPPREEPRVMQAPAPAPPPAPARKAAPEPPAAKGFAPDPKPLADSAAPGREEYERRAAKAEMARMQAQLEESSLERQAAVAAARADSGEESKRLRSAAAEAPARRPAEGLSSLGAAAAYRSPEQWLLGIDDLKRQGRHEEAEKQLAEFRKRYPGYRIPEAILQKFEK